MNLTISPYRNTAINNNPSFKAKMILGGGDSDHFDYSEDDNKTNYKVDYDTYKKDLSHAMNTGAGGGFIAGMVTAIILASVAIGADNKDSVKQTDKFISKADSVLNSKDIEKDSFMVKDMNGDERPDFVLFKKDGSKVVLDIANKEVLEESKRLNVVK